LRNFVARAIATESVDTRDWMRASSPDELLRAAASVLRSPPAREGESLVPPTRLRNVTVSTPRPSAHDRAATATNLVEALGRPVWIDFVADTGDDRDVSSAVGAMLAASYDVQASAASPNERLVLPRGDILLFGGDIAYPVATAEEIYRRLVQPWNEQLRAVDMAAAVGPTDDTGGLTQKRVILGVPGNHDWYDGLDGFGRLFRRRVDKPFRADEPDRARRLGVKLRSKQRRQVGLVARELHLDEVSAFYKLVIGLLRVVRAFFKGVSVTRRRRLALRGYVPVQEASYFALPLAPGLDMFGGDRQLGRLDFRQRAFFTEWREAHPERAVMFVSADPATVYGMRNDAGARMLSACRLSLERDRIFYLSGDFHHYERRSIRKSMHIVAGGGGAFLHGTRICAYPDSAGPPAAAYPSRAASRRLALQAPIKLALGRAGWLVHVTFALVATVELAASKHGPVALAVTCAAMSIFASITLFLAAHQGYHKRRIVPIAAAFGLVLGWIPAGLRLSVEQWPSMAGDAAVTLTSSFASALLFGAYFTLLALLGLEHQQAFTMLGHPGYKHFVRLRVHASGYVEGWVIGKDDPLASEPAHLIDAFSWSPNDEH